MSGFDIQLEQSENYNPASKKLVQGCDMPPVIYHGTAGLKTGLRQTTGSLLLFPYHLKLPKIFRKVLDHSWVVLGGLENVLEKFCVLF